jgi:hypothetical protein
MGRKPKSKDQTMYATDDRDDFVNGIGPVGVNHEADDDDGFSKRRAEYARRLAEIQERALAEPDDERAIELVADAIYADPMALGFAIMDAEIEEGGAL